MARNRTTSLRAARAASRVLRDRRTSKTSKTAAGSALSQRPSRRKGKLRQPLDASVDVLAGQYRSSRLVSSRLASSRRGNRLAEQALAEESGGMPAAAPASRRDNRGKWPPQTSLTRPSPELVITAGRRALSIVPPRSKAVGRQWLARQSDTSQNLAYGRLFDSGRASAS
jgi:hypothetical protein